MKIALINSVCYGSTGKITCGLGRISKSQGHQVRIFFGRGNGAADLDCMKIESDLSVYAHVIKTRLLDRQGFGSRIATKRLVSELEAFRPDVIHLHNLHGYWLHLPTLFQYLKSCHKPVIWTLHDCWPFTGHCAYFDGVGCEKWKTQCGSCPQKGGYPQSLLLDQSQRNFLDKRKLFTGIENLTIATPSSWLMALAKESFLGVGPTPPQFAVLPNGIDQTVFAPTESDIRARYGLEGKTILLGVANVWEPRKGLTTFFELRDRLDASYAIVLIGLNDKQRANLPKGILGLPRTDGPIELAAWYTAADVFVNPTFEENFPTTHLEALSCGAPVVTYNAGGSGEMLNKACGIAVPVGDIQGLLEGIFQAKNFLREDCLAQAAHYGEQARLGDYVELYQRLHLDKSAT